MANREPKLFFFGLFQVDCNSRELRKSGMRVNLPDQPFQVLVLLLEHAGEVVTREQLREKLWSPDTFVDFDHSLNTNINKIRDALGDSATNPRFVETLAKRGYRFIASVTRRNDSEVDAVAIPGASSNETARPIGLALTTVDDLPIVSGHLVRGLFLLIQVMYLSFYIAALANLGGIANVIDHLPGGHPSAFILVIASAAVGIPLRLYMLAAAGFDVSGLSRNFLKLFPATLLLDELWALAPFLLAPQIGIGLALAATAALMYCPFAQRTLLLMRQRATMASGAGVWARNGLSAKPPHRRT
jgi:cholera toxin transcriptional activator